MLNTWRKGPKLAGNLEYISHEQPYHDKRRAARAGNGWHWYKGLRVRQRPKVLLIEFRPVYDNACSGNEGKVTDLPEPDTPTTEKVAVRRAMSDLSLPLVIINLWDTKADYDICC